MRPLAGDDIVAVAQKAGLVCSSEQLRARLEKRISSAPLFEQAKFAFSRHEFLQAKRLLEKVLQSQPNNVEAVIVAGLLRKRHALNQPNLALPFYERAQTVGKEPSEVLAGMYLQFLWHIRAGNRDRAAQLGGTMLRRYDLEGDCRARVLDALSKLMTAAPTKKGSQ